MKRYVWISLLVLTAAAPARVGTYYVSTKGSDENPGSKTRPLRTIQKAADTARTADTILVRDGVYREPVVLRFSGQKGKPIVLKNYPGERPVIQPGELAKQPPAHALLLQAREGYQKPIGWIVIEGLEIRYGWDGVKFYNAHDIIIRRCNIHENWNQGILGNGNRVLIDRNIIAGNGTNKTVAQNLLHGIYATGSAFTITNNLIHSNTAYGIQVAAYDYKEDSMAGPEYADAKNWLIANNTIALNKNRAGTVIWQDGVENCVVQNNIFCKNGGVNGILFYSQQNRRHRVRNNIFYPPGENLVATEDNAYEATDNQQVDPCFVDVDAFDFHLKAGSPAIDAGIADRAPKTDFDGKPRPQGNKVDTGAYERRPAADQAPPPVIKAFPTAEGFGAHARGGRGGRIIEVTNLNDSGHGSLRSCMEASGPRICVFRVSGTVTLKSAIRVSSPYLTVAGQTSPGGVQIKGSGQPKGDWGVWCVNGAHDIIMRHLRVRMGGNMQHDAGNNILFYGTAEPGVHDVIVDHCSVCWGSDTQLDWYGSYLDRATFQWNIIAECYMGQHIGGNLAPKNITLHHNLYANLGSRTPLMQHADVFDFRNNVIYNWNGNNSAVFGQFALNSSAFGNIVDNLWLAGPESGYPYLNVGNGGPVRIDGSAAEKGGTRLYISGNWGPRCPAGCANDWTGHGVNTWDYYELNKDGSTHVVDQAQYDADRPFPAPPVALDPLSKLLDKVLPTVGAYKPSRDAIDRRIVKSVRDKTGTYRVGTSGPWPDLAAGAPAPPPDSDRDGMPDTWEKRHDLDPDNADDGAALAPNGYTNVENYLNELAG
ncbi:MAG: right-handed parallel beta-helix repeat-containing protein [Phycisphaerales bacterium]|nr:MAG: right-handed parallel beta-helix repeat-containing protein [Phycisphaerales bacterium]